MRRCLLTGLGACLLAAAPVLLGAQSDRLPSARLVPASTLEMPAAFDSTTPLVWDLVDGTRTLFVFGSWGGVPSRLTGPQLDRLQRGESITLVPHPGHGVWLEAIIPDEGGTWYGFYHHEVPADVCGRPDRTILDIGAARSVDRGLTWEDLGVILEAPRDGLACASSNRFLVGGVGDPSVILDADHRDLYIFFTQYSKERSVQGVAIARMAWADRDAPAGRVTVRQDGAWLPAREVENESGQRGWEYPAGTPLVPVSNPWHDRDSAVDAFWGASVHWNSYLEQWVMLLNRAKDENFNNEGLYVSYASDLGDPHAWSAPRKLMNGGGWYPQVAGLEAGGTDREAGQRARFFVTGRSTYFIEFQR